MLTWHILSHHVLTLNVKILKIGTLKIITITIRKWDNLVSHLVTYSNDTNRKKNSVGSDQTEQSGLGLPFCLDLPVPVIRIFTVYKILA